MLPMQKTINVVDVFTDKQILRRSKWRRGLILDTQQHKAICHGKLEEGFCLMRPWLMLVTGWVDQRNRLKLGSDVFLQTTRVVEKKLIKVKSLEQFRKRLLFNFTTTTSSSGLGENELTVQLLRTPRKVFNNRWPEDLCEPGDTEVRRSF